VDGDERITVGGRAERENWRRVMRKETFSALRWGWKEKKERKKRARSAGLWKM
jgi:hypothetical protein